MVAATPHPNKDLQTVVTVFTILFLGLSIWDIFQSNKVRRLEVQLKEHELQMKANAS